MNDNKWDFLLKAFLVFTFFYFLFHVGLALANSTPPTMQCTSNGMGTIICYPL
jgi:hypothetical protein